MPFRYVWVIMVFIGALQPIDPIWRLGDIANASMAIPNLIAILLLSGVVFSITKRFDKTGELPPNWAGDSWGTEESSDEEIIAASSNDAPAETDAGGPRR